ncbi:hypothetical protein IFM89_001337 [Coptis chinensis]|uniref:SWIM-type domain-containing protein n=1 Tax=Coptis chinensis TaxID=261450 RepID=A0A835LCE2_9MAGN|nr:hypothetical protein IFM89_001337 [Coptis chinensis]
MTLMRKRKLIANSLDGNDVVPRVKKIYETMKKGVTNYNWTSSNDYEWIVTGKEGQRWTVNIPDHTCECKKWMCSDYLTVATYRKTYEEGVRPIPNSDDWPEDGIDIETARGRGRGHGITEPSQASGGNGIGQSIGGPSLASGGQNGPAAGQSAPDAGPRSQFQAPIPMGRGGLRV